MIEVDARGLSCPLPVLKTKNALDENKGEEIRVTVNQEAQVENISRIAKKQGCEIEVEQNGDEYTLRLKPAQGKE